MAPLTERAMLGDAEYHASLKRARDAAAESWDQTWENINTNLGSDRTPAARVARWIVPGRARRHRERYRTASRDLDHARSLMRNLFVGAGRQWGVLSCGYLTESGHQNGHARGVEGVVTTAAYGVSGASRERATWLLRDLPFIRGWVQQEREVAARHVEHVEDEVLAIAEDPAIDRHLRRALLDFVPARRRPAVDDLEDLERAWRSDGSLATLLVSWDLRLSPQSPRVIKLHDIVVAPGMKGCGLGTETLAELCAFADRKGAEIVGEFVPSPDEARASIARWYAKAGFTSGSAAPDTWRLGAWISRAPQPSA